MPDTMRQSACHLPVLPVRLKTRGFFLRLYGRRTGIHKPQVTCHASHAGAWKTARTTHDGACAVKIGPAKHRASAISTANADMIVVRGRDLCGDLIGKVSLTQHFWLLTTGELPSPPQARILDACLVAIAEHGLVPSVQARSEEHTSELQSLRHL